MTHQRDYIYIATAFLIITPLLFTLTLFAENDSQSQEIKNPQIDSKTFLIHISESHKQRTKHRVTEKQFIEMSREQNTIILDARSVKRFKQMHIAGSHSLPFTEFSEQALKTLIPNKKTRILIYCNNNITNSPEAFFKKAVSASLNLSTYTSLYSYGYKNVYELGPVIDPQTSLIQFEGTLR